MELQATEELAGSGALDGAADQASAPHTSAAPIAVPIQREQREKKESLKKREATSALTGNALGKRKAPSSSAYPTPQRYNTAPPRSTDFELPKPDTLLEHEGTRLYVPGQDRQLYRPDVADNKRGFRYVRAIPDPHFPHKQFYRSTSPGPHHAKLSLEDADRLMHFTRDTLCTTNEKGWRMARANVCAREGTLYYEVRIRRGIPPEGPELGRTTPAPHVRFGWARREAPLDAPVGFDGYSYGITDMRCETIHRSRPGSFFHAVKKGSKVKGAKVAIAGPSTVVLAPGDQHIKEDDIIGVEIQLPSLSLHQKIVSGVYNPAVDIGDGFEQKDGLALHGPDEVPLDIIRDRLCVPYKAHLYFEFIDHIPAKPMETYADRTISLSSISAGHVSLASLGKDAIKTPPNPNHEEVTLRTLPHSAIRMYKNGVLVGTAFENLLAFLPPASTPGKLSGAKEGLDDGMVGYYPAVACFFGGVAELNFGDGPEGFWAPPAHLQTAGRAAASLSSSSAAWNPGSTPRPVGQRYKEQIAEDVVWDVIDEVDFYVQDNGVLPKI